MERRTVATVARKQFIRDELCVSGCSVCVDDVSTIFLINVGPPPPPSGSFFNSGLQSSHRRRRTVDAQWHAAAD